MNNILIKYHKNWADELDVEGFMLWTEEKWNEHLSKVKEYFEKSPHTVEMYFGTNEAIEYDNFEEYKRSFEVKKITPEEAKTLKKLFDEKLGHVLLIEDFE
jgi:hypothetical protein